MALRSESRCSSLSRLSRWGPNMWRALGARRAALAFHFPKRARMSLGGSASRGCATLHRDWPFLAFMAWGRLRDIGIILLTLAVIPMGDMLVILAAKGSPKSAFAMHGLTAVLMVLAAILMMV